MKRILAIALLMAGTVWAQDDVKVKGKSLSQWVKQLQGSNRGLQVRAARALSEAPAETHAAIIPNVLPLLKSPRENDKFVAAQILGEYGPPAKAAVPDLLAMLEGTEYERNRAGAAKALGQILKDAEPSAEIDNVAERLAAKFNEQYDTYSDVRREAVYAIGMIGPAAKKVIPKLTRALTDYKQYSDEHFMVRKAAAWTCGRMGPLAAEHMDRLLSMMQSEGQNAPEYAEAIGRVGPLNENVVMNIVDKMEVMKDWSPAMAASYSALETFGPKSMPVLPYLLRVLRTTPNNRVPIEPLIASVKVIGAIGPAAKEALPLLEKMKTYESHPHAEISKEWHDKLHKAAEEAIAKVIGK